MLHTRIHQCLIIVLILLLTFSVSAGNVSACKVLVVMTYWEDYFWSQDIQRGVEEVLGDHCDLRYVYLDVMKDPDGVETKAKEAYAVYQEWQPDGVITTNDDAQTRLVLPYLKDKVNTPVMFAGIFAPPETYGYPASNVSGILERAYFKESLVFLRQLEPSVNSFMAVAPDIAAARQVVQKLRAIQEELSLDAFEAILENDIETLLAKVEQKASEYDSLFIPAIYDPETTMKLVQRFGKPTFSGWRPAVEYGVLCAVTEDGTLLGKRAAEMLLEAMNGTSPAEMPVEQNEFGVRVININTMKALGLKPSRRLLTGVELIK